MRKLIYLLLALVIAVGISVSGCGCSGDDNVILPSADEIIADVLGDYVMIDLVIDGKVYHFTLADIIKGVRKAADAWEPDGTDMSPDELRQYFAVNVVKTNLPVFVWCPAYAVIMGQFAYMPDQTFTTWANVMEQYGYDVPNGPPPDDPCW